MAILRGFPPSNTISPSVRITEKDLSFVPPDQSFHRAGLVGFASKGPIGLPTVVRTTRQLNTIFGYPHPEQGDPYLIYAAQQYLLVANELYIVRVGDTTNVSDERAEKAEIEIESSGGKIDVISETAGPYVFDVASFFKWKLNGVLNERSLVVLAGTYSAAELATALNEQLDTVLDGIEFYATTDNEIAVRTVWAYGPNASLEFVSIQDSIYGGQDVTVGGEGVTGLGTLMTPAVITSDNGVYPQTTYATDGTWDFTGLTSLTLQVVIDGTDNANIDNVIQTIDFSDFEGEVPTTGELVNHINSLVSAGTIPGGFGAVGGGVGPAGHAARNADNITLETLHTGRDAKLLVRNKGLSSVFGFDNTTVSGASPQGVSGASNMEEMGILTGPPNTTGELTFTITADTEGIDGNSTQVVITNNTRENNFRMNIYNNGIEVESWGGLTMDSSSRFYVETFIALVSDWIRVVDNTATAAPPVDGTYSLSGGTDGIPADPDEQDSLLVGNPLDYSGLYALSEPEQIDIDLIAIPGHSSTQVVLELLYFCQNVRLDCLAVIDPPFGLTVNEIVAWQNGQHPLNTTRFDSDFGALYWPWLKMRDTFNRVDVWVPPSGSIMAVMARSDQLGAPWLPPAGTTRGIVPNITDVFQRPTLAERDLVYGDRNAINPIVQFVDEEGFLVWGQKTLQRRPTALDRVNVRRLMFVIEKRIRRASRQLLFEPHDEIFRQRFIDIATDILREIQVGRGITAFIIQADDELNTADTIDRNEFHARIGIQPTRAVEFMFIEFSIHRTGSFTENADTF